MAFSFTPQQPQQSPFQFPFQQTNPFQSQSQPQPQPQQQQQSPFQFQLQLPQQQQQLPQQPQPMQQPYLLNNDKTPASYTTKWADLHPDSQKVLLQIEERMLEYRDESRRLDQCRRLYDSSISSNGFELDSSSIVQELGGISVAMDRQKEILQELMIVVKDMLRNAEVAVRSFLMLRPRFLHQNKAAAAASVTAPPQPLGVGAAQTYSSQPAVTTSVQVLDFYSGIPKKPSPFLDQTVTRFEKHLFECHQWIEELEQLLLLDSEKNSLNPNSLIYSLPKVMANVYEFFVHVAAKVESLHQQIESMKIVYLADQRCRGYGNDPFLEADRRETAKQEAAARRVHPTLHLPGVSHIPAQVTGLSMSSAAFATTATTLSPAVMPSSSGSGSQLFTTQLAPSSSPLFSTPSSSPSLFSNPSTSGPVLSLLGTAAAQSSPFSSLPASTPALGISTPLFGSTPSTGASTFSTPFATGAATGSGASFGTVSKARAKSRTGRR